MKIRVVRIPIETIARLDQLKAKGQTYAGIIKTLIDIHTSSVQEAMGSSGCT